MCLTESARTADVRVQSGSRLIRRKKEDGCWEKFGFILRFKAPNTRLICSGTSNRTFKSLKCHCLVTATWREKEKKTFPVAHSAEWVENFGKSCSQVRFTTNLHHPRQINAFAQVYS